MRQVVMTHGGLADVALELGLAADCVTCRVRVTLGQIIAARACRPNVVAHTLMWSTSFAEAGWDKNKKGPRERGP